MSSSSYITESSAKATLIGLFTTTAVVAATRLGLSAYTTRTFKWEDGFFLLAFAAYATLTGLFLNINSFLFDLIAIGEGKMAPGPTFAQDYPGKLQRLFATTALLYTVLWSIKFSLLALYKQLLSRTIGYIRLWWALIVFCSVSLVVALLTFLLACEADPRNAWSMKSCSTPEGAFASLWTNYALDVATDFFIMLLPLGILRQIQMPIGKKLGVGLMFSLGLVCIAFATVRVKQVGSTASSTKLPNVTWLEVWGAVECALAVWVGSAPGIYRSCKNLVRKKRTYGSSLPISSGPATKRSRYQADIEMDGKYSRRVVARHLDDEGSSQEKLADSPIHGINVTTETSVKSIGRGEADPWDSPMQKSYS